MKRNAHLTVPVTSAFMIILAFDVVVVDALCLGRILGIRGNHLRVHCMCVSDVGGTYLAGSSCAF